MEQEESNFPENHLTTIFQRTARTRGRQLIFVRKPRLVTSYVHTQMRVLRASRFACQPIEFAVTCVLVSTRPTAASLNLIFLRAQNKFSCRAFFISTFPGDRRMYPTRHRCIYIHASRLYYARTPAILPPIFAQRTNQIPCQELTSDLAN